MRQETGTWLQVWKDWVPEANGHTAEAVEEGPLEEDVPVTVTEIVDANQFFIQVRFLGSPILRWPDHPE